jgi:hypothetical protein
VTACPSLWTYRFSPFGLSHFSGEQPARILQVEDEIFGMGDVLKGRDEQLCCGNSRPHLQSAPVTLSHRPSGETRAIPRGAFSKASEKAFLLWCRVVALRRNSSCATAWRLKACKAVSGPRSILVVFDP